MIKKSLSVFCLALALSFFFTSCDPKESDPIVPVSEQPTTGVLQVKVNPFWNGTAITPTSIHQDAFGNALKIIKFTSYLCMIELQRENGTYDTIKDYYMGDILAGINLNIAAAEGSYSGIRFLIGVPSDVNTNIDPAQYPNSHPLSVAGAQGMFWTWNSGYIFTKLEGRVDNTGVGEEMTGSFAYHSGADSNARTVALDVPLSIQRGQTTALQLNVNVDKIFSPVSGTSINPDEETAAHSPGPLMLKFVDNLANAYSVQ